MVAVADEAFEGMLEDGMNGYAVPLDVKKYADTLADLLPDRERLKRFGEHSMMLSEKYSIEAQVKALEKLYHRSHPAKLARKFLPAHDPQTSTRFPQRINRIIRTEIGKIMPRKKRKKI
jgi:hypothetical protein